MLAATQIIILASKDCYQNSLTSPPANASASLRQVVITHCTLVLLSSQTGPGLLLHGVAWHLQVHSPSAVCLGSLIHPPPLSVPPSYKLVLSLSQGSVLAHTLAPSHHVALSAQKPSSENF